MGRAAGRRDDGIDEPDELLAYNAATKKGMWVEGRKEGKGRK